VCPGAIVGVAGEIVTHFASERGVFVDAAGSVMAEQAHSATQHRSLSAERGMHISGVLAALRATRPT
jgi:uncharacterized protein YdeI (BOF family)